MFGEKSNLVLAQIKRGQAVIVIGAGANAGSTNRKDEPIVFGNGLSARLAEEMGELYNNEPLSQVASAATHLIGKEAVNQILIREFRYCKPSATLSELFNYTWNRLYTWNYDDTIRLACKEAVQRVTFYNGMHSAIEEIDRPANLQIVHLHGDITEIDKSLILTREDYAKALQSNRHNWYKEIASDYKSNLIIFVGSSLEEPILEAEVQRATQPENDLGGFKFVVTPDALSGIQKASLEARKIIHSQGTLQDFVNWLKAEIGPKLEPRNLIEDQKYFTKDNLGKFKHEDIETAQHIRPIQRQKLAAQFAALPEHQKVAIGRNFLLGFPVSWEIAASEIPVRLSQTDTLAGKLSEIVGSKIPLFVTVGQAGGGKSTATMQALLDLSDQADIDVFELDPAVKSLSSVISVLKRISDRPNFIYIRNLFVFGERLRDVFADARDSNIIFVTTARSSEWQEHFKRHFEGESATFTYQRFEPVDFKPLIEQLKKYVPAPSFVKLAPDKQIDSLRRSKSQLLIALREVTESRNFDDIIRDEYRSLDNRDVQDLFLITGIATLARVGVDQSRASEAYDSKARSLSFNEAMQRLVGIVEPAQNGRLVARHEFYVRNILDSEASIEEIFDSIGGLLGTFTKYQIPITAHVSRVDAALFRFLLNHSVLRERAERAGDRERGLQIYREFELQFQLDGHYWLQYGLYHQRLGQTADALIMLERSIQAFPGNPFAQHALASLQLRQASQRDSFDDETRRLIRTAVSSLEKLDKTDNLFFDQYPLVTLSRHHVGALVKHGQIKEATSLCKEYYERLKILEKRSTTSEITEEKARLLTFATTGEWRKPALWRDI